MPTVRRPTGRQTSSATTRARTRGRTSPRPGRITCTSSTRSRSRGAFGLSTQPRLARDEELDASVDFDPYRVSEIGRLFDSWMPLSLALNSLNRAMGQPDVYPFVLSPPVIEKLGFIHRLIHPTR